VLNHIAFFLFWLNGGGIPRVLVNLAGGMCERGYRVDFVLGSAEGAYLDDLNKRIKVIDLNVSRSKKCIPGLASYLKDQSPQILITANTHLNCVALAAKLLSRNTRTKLIVSEHADVSSRFGYKTLQSRFMNRSVPKMLYPGAANIVAVSQGVSNSIVENFKLDASKVTTIWNPVITESMLSKAEEPMEDPLFKKNRGYKIIIGVGRLKQQKNFPLLVEAFSMLNKDLSVKLVILGEGPDRKMLEALVNEKGLQNDIFLPGLKNNPYKYLKNSDLFVLSSLWEGLPTVLIEALSCGLNVVSTDCPSGPAEIIDYAGKGLLIPSRDAKAMVIAIEKLLQDSNHTKPRLEAFELPFVIDRYVELFESVL
jgi:glycosyltransferase involved in cell wall biosynthesis